MGDETGETVWAFAVRDLVCHVKEQQAEERPPPLHSVHMPIPGTGGVLGYVVKGIKASLGIEVADKPPWRQEEFLDCLSGPCVILTGGGGGGRQESQGRGR